MNQDTRTCPNCSRKVFLTRGKRSGLFWFIHDFNGDDCPFSVIGTRLKFRCREDAMRAEKIFEEPKTQPPTEAPTYAI